MVPRVSVARDRAGWSHVTFYDLALEITQSHLCCVLLVQGEGPYTAPLDGSMLMSHIGSLVFGK